MLQLMDAWNFSRFSVQSILRVGLGLGPGHSRQKLCDTVLKGGAELNQGPTPDLNIV